MAGASLAFEILAKDKASKVFDKAADSVDDMNDSVGRAAGGLDRVGEGADGAETRIMGLKDSVDGAASIMAGPGEQGIAAYLQGWADFSSGVANFAVPAFKKLIDGGVQQVASMARATAATVANIAKQIAQWVIMGVQSTIQAGKVAAAWLISIGPIAAVGLAIAGLVYLVIEHWDTIVGVFQGAIDLIKGIVGGVIDWVGDNWPLLLAILTGPIGLAVLAITTHWDTIKNGIVAVKDWIVERFGDVVDFVTGLPGKIARAASGMWDGIKTAFKSTLNWIIRGWNSLEFKIPGFDPPGPGPKFGGFTLGLPKIPELATGGIVTSPTIALIGERGPEAVVPLDQFAGANRPLIDVGGITIGRGDRKSARELVFELRALAMGISPMGANPIGIGR